MQRSFLCVQVAKCERIIFLDDNLLIKIPLVSINPSVFKLNYSYGGQTLHNSDGFFVWQLLFWLSAGSMVVEGGGRSGWQLQPGCSANTLFTITSSHLAVVLELFVLYQPKERKRWIRFYTFVLNNKLIARSLRLLRLLSIFDIENNLSVFDAEKSKTYQMFNLICFVFLISCILVCFGNI